MDQKDYWDVHKEINSSSVKKSEIMPNQITKVNNQIKLSGPVGPIIKIARLDYNQDRAMSPARPGPINELQYAFNSNSNTRDVEFSNPVKNKEYIRKSLINEGNPKFNNPGPGLRSPERVNKIQIPARPFNRQHNGELTPPVSYNRGSHQRVDPEESGLINTFEEVFPQLHKLLIIKVVTKNKGKTIEELYEILSNNALKESSSVTPESKSFKSQVKDKFEGFKKNLCQNTANCADPLCKSYHYQGERRRLVDEYSSKICEDEKCQRSEACPNAHTLTEVFFHSKIYKKIPCPFIECPLGQLCKFSHGKMAQASNLTEKLSNEIEETMKKQNQVLDSIENITKSINELQKESRMLRGLLVCCHCEKFRIEYVLQPCTHSLCGKCEEGMKQSNICIKCGVQAQVLKIDYNFNQ